MQVGRRPTVCVIFATKGRPQVLAEALLALSRQTLQPSLVILSITTDSDIGELKPRPGILVKYGELGLTKQRNVALRAVPADTDFVVFFDDDFIPHPEWLGSVVRAFECRPDVSGITGHLLADGVLGTGISFDESLRLLEQQGPAGMLDRDWMRESKSPYGCNMAFRFDAIRDLRFDERLVLIGWLEDRDFGARVAQRGGRLIQLGTALGVHRGVKAAKVSDRVLGYAQVVNPIYLRRKGTMTTRQLAVHVLKHLASNLLRSWAPEPHIDRASRLRGNLIGLLDVLRARAEPERAQQM